MEELQELLTQMKNDGKNVEEFFSQLNTFSGEYRSIEMKIGSDDGTVNHFIDAFYEFETQVKNFHRTTKHNQTESIDHKMEEIKSSVMQRGSVEDRERIEQLEDDYDHATTQTEKQHILRQMEDIETESRFNNFEWLRASYEVVFGQDRVAYKNPSNISSKGATTAFLKDSIFSCSSAGSSEWFSTA